MLLSTLGGGSVIPQELVCESLSARACPEGAAGLFRESLSTRACPEGAAVLFRESLSTRACPEGAAGLFRESLSTRACPREPVRESPSERPETSLRGPQASSSLRSLEVQFKSSLRVEELRGVEFISLYVLYSFPYRYEYGTQCTVVPY